MSLLTNLTRHLYFETSLPLRWWSRHRAVARGCAPLAVLCYHRVADDAASPWTISRQGFARHIGWLRKHFDLVSLEETQRRIRSGGNGRAAVSITFDDGYSDNCDWAIPLLEENNIPCTYFVCARHVLQSQPFGHGSSGNRRFAPNTVEQLRAIAAAGIEIAAHGYTHLDLGPVTDPLVLKYEIVAAREDLAAAIGRRVRYFAFPYGQPTNLNRAAVDLARDAGYEAVLSAYGGLNTPGDDGFHLLRIAADCGLLRLKHRLIGDPFQRLRK